MCFGSNHHEVILQLNRETGKKPIQSTQIQMQNLIGEYRFRFLRWNRDVGG
jgi:hypothetical protein